MSSLITTIFSFTLLKQILLIVNLFLGVVILALFIFVLVHKRIVERTARRDRELRDGYLADLCRASYDDQLPLRRPATCQEFEACGGAVAELLASVEGEMALRIRRLARDLGIDRHYRGRLRSRSWVKRYAAVERLGYLGAAELKPLFIEVIDREGDFRIIAKALWAVSLIATPDDLPLLNRHLQTPRFMSGKFNQFLYANVIRAFRERGEERELVELFVRLLADPSLPVLLKRDLVQACGEELVTGLQEEIRRAGERHADQPEMRIAVIRALERLAVPYLTDLITASLRDPDWRIRAAAAKDAHLCANGIVAPVRGALYDASYHVRINAAHSLVRLGEGGLQALVAETRSADRFVRDVSQYVLKRMIYAA